MKISTRGRYSLRLMIDLAQHEGEGYIALKDISERQGISKKYLEQIIPHLSDKNLLLSTRGHQGGYKLARTPAEITVREIIESAESSLTPVSCLEDSENLCPRHDFCLTLPIYAGLEKVISDYLEGITLQDILDGKIKKIS